MHLPFIFENSCFSAVPIRHIKRPFNAAAIPLKGSAQGSREQHAQTSPADPA